MKKTLFFLFSGIVVAALSLASCDQLLQPGNHNDPDDPVSPSDSTANKVVADTVDVNFMVSLIEEEVTDSSAGFNVRHNGTIKSTWFYIVTKDLTSNAKALLKAEAAKGSDIQVDSCAAGTVAHVTVSALEQGTDYRIIVGGLYDGKVYGEPSAQAFTTKYGPYVREESWTIEFDPSVEFSGGAVYPAFKVNKPDSVLVSAYLITSTEFESYFESDMAAFLEEMDWEAPDANYNTFGYGMSYGVNYIFVIVGFDAATKKPLRKYNFKEQAMDPPAEAPEGYEDWLGEWEIIIHYAPEDKYYTYFENPIRIEPDVVGGSYKVFGWGPSKDDSVNEYNLDFSTDVYGTASFDRNDKHLSFTDSGKEFTYIDSEGQEQILYWGAWWLYQGSYMGPLSRNWPAAVCSYDEIAEGAVSIVPNSLLLTNGETLTPVLIGFTILFENGTKIKPAPYCYTMFENEDIDEWYLIRPEIDDEEPDQVAPLRMSASSKLPAPVQFNGSARKAFFPVSSASPLR